MRPRANCLHRESSPFFRLRSDSSEFVATLALAQDNAFGQPLESQLRSCLLASWMCEAAGFEQHGARHRLLGGAAPLHRLHRPRARGGDAVRRRDRDSRADARARRRRIPPRSCATSSPSRRRAEPQEEREQIVQLHSAERARVGDAQLLVGLRSGRHAPPAARLRSRRARGAALHVRAVERQGLSQLTRSGDAIPLPMRVVHLSHDMEAIAPSLFAGARARSRARPPRPDVRSGARRPVPRARSASGSTRLAKTEPWDAVLALEPTAAPRARRRDARRRAPDGGGLHRSQIAVHGRAQPALRAARRRCRPRARLLRGRHRRAPPRGARARLRHDRGAELDLGQARRAHARGVRSRRAAPDADRADAAPLAGAGGAESRRVRAPREVRRIRLPQARARRRRRSRRAACWPRPRSTSG